MDDIFGLIFDNSNDTNKVKNFRKLLVEGANPNIRDEYGMTPLHVIAFSTNSCDNALEMAELLLEHGADPNIQINNGMTPLESALFHDNFKMVRLLLINGADPNIRNNEGKLIDIAIEYGCDKQTIELLQSSMLDIKEPDCS